MAELALGVAGGGTGAGTILAARQNLELIDAAGDVILSPTAGLGHIHFKASPSGNLGGFAAGNLHLVNPSALVNAGSVMTGHNSFGGNKQLWYLGSAASSNDDVAFINRQNGALSLFTSNIDRFKIDSAGAINVPVSLTAGQLNAASLQLDGNTLSSQTGDLVVTTQTGGVFKFVDNAFRSGLDASNYLEIGHGGSNSFLNQVGAGGMDFRFAGVTKATFTPAGHLHLLTDVDQKHTLKIKTASNLSDTGISWENSGGAFTHSIFRTDVGSNRADLVFAAGQNVNVDLLIDSFKIHGEAADEGKLEVLGAFQISSGSPGANKVLTSDANGIATWVLASGGGFTDAGATIILTNINDDVGIGTSSPNAKLDVGGNPGASVGGFPSGQLHVTGQSASVNTNAVITGHNLFGGNKQLWYLGSTSGSNDNIGFINRQTGSLSLITSGNSDILLSPAGTGKVGIGVTPTEKLDVNGNIKADTIIDKAIVASLSSSVDQNPSDTNPTAITYNTQSLLKGMTHSTTVNPGEITIDTEGAYIIFPQPQVGKTSGAAKTDFDMFLQVDRGSGFVDEPDSNIKLTIKDSERTDVIVSCIPVELNVGNKIRMMQRVSSSTVGLGLKNTDPEVGPPTVPRTPSIIFSMYRFGGLAA